MISSGLKEDILRFLRALWPFDVRDCLIFGGIGCAAYGISMVSLPASLVFGGLMLFYLGIR